MATFTIDLLTGNVYLFSGDFTGSGGTPTSGSTYPQVNAFSNLPSPALQSSQVYLVRNDDGTTVLNRHPAGLYYSTGSVWRYLGDTPAAFYSNNFQIVDSTDTTKGAMFVTSGITSNVFRKLKIQNSDGTIAYLTDLDTKVDTSVFANYTGTTVPNTYLSKSAFNTYSATTETNINDRLSSSISIFNTYTGTTVPNTYLSKAAFNTYTGTTAPNTYLSIANFNTYSGTTVPANYYNKTQINSYTGATNTRINSKASLSGATFTGEVYGLTPITNSNTTQFATTAFVVGQASAVNPLMNGSVAIGTSLRYSRQDHVHPVDTSRQATITGAATTITTSNLTIDRVLVSDGSGKVAVSTVTSAQLIALLAAHVYGSEYQLASDLTSTSTSSVTPVTKVTMTTTNLPAGTYKIIVHWVWNRNNPSSSARFDVTIGDVAQGTRNVIQIEPQDPSNFYPETRIFYKALSGVNTIQFRYWSSATSNSTTTSDATIELIRVE